MENIRINSIDYNYPEKTKFTCIFLTCILNQFNIYNIMRVNKY